MSPTPELQSLWLRDDAQALCIIDQRALPFRLRVEELASVEEVCTAIREMHLRGAPLIGVAAAYGMYLAAVEAARGAGPERLNEAARLLVATRPTAVNLAWAVRRQLAELADARDPDDRVRLPCAPRGPSKRRTWSAAAASASTAGPCWPGSWPARRAPRRA